MSTVCEHLLSEVRGFLGRFREKAARSFAGDIDWSMPPRSLAPRGLACLVHLARAQMIAGEAARPLATLLRDHVSSFRWGQTYVAADFGQHFIDNYGWLEVFGTRGHFVNADVAGGFLLLGPDLEYPDHHHEAEELYIPLTPGTEWRMGGGAWRVRAAGEVIHHASDISHAMRTGPEPLLAFYLWRGGPLAARSTVTGVAGEARG
ncbi:dimethylsulfonioproprionate lyase family protein [Mesorhizobium sp. ZMM04-5]|uniref:Dimethylsulfonioproprionate lyase family protein n=1 Tax=Mesorhizobium marinum TaxID=3228790 RepID=A0ABV3QW44_9HYPH